MGIWSRLSFLFNVSIFSNQCCISCIFRISNYGKASTDFAAYILGGAFGLVDRTSIIAEFRNNKWQKIGDLKEIKSDTSSIFHSGEYLIVGGDAQGGRRLVN